LRALRRGTPVRLDDPPPASVRRTAALCVKHVRALIDVWAPSLKSIESYANDLVSDTELRDDGALVFEYMIRLIGGLPVRPELAAMPAKIGTNRARQEVPLDDVLLAIRTDYQVIWRAMLSFSRAEEQADLLESATRVWAAVEQLIVGVSRAYRDTALELARHRADEQQEWFSRLCHSRGQSRQVVDSAARVLGVAAHGTFLVVAATAESSSRLRIAARTAHDAGRLGMVLKTADGDVLLVQESRRAGSFCDSLPPGALTYVDEVEGLAKVPEAVGIAVAAAATLPPGIEVAVSVEKCWPAVFVAEAYGRAAFLRDRVVSRLPEQRRGERQALLATLASYFRTGSVPETAEAQYCHRNTILNRLSQVRAMTGLDPRIPEEAAVLILALEADRLSPVS
jgi:DNA-binding PucR family transcriptional regulator